MKQYSSKQVIKFRSRNERSELERINRLTGLDFSSLPTSLLLDNTNNPQELAWPLFQSEAGND